MSSAAVAVRVRVLAPLPISSAVKTNAFHTAKAMNEDPRFSVTWVDPPTSPLHPLATLPSGIPWHVEQHWRNPAPGARSVSFARRLATAYARHRLRSLAPVDVTLAYTPLAVEMAGKSGTVIYHLVDAPGAWAEKAESLHAFKRALECADLVLAASEEILEVARAMAPRARIRLFENAVDSSLFVFRRRQRTIVPTASYIGAVDPRKIDFALLEGICDELPNWQFTVRGPLAQEATEIVRLLRARLPNFEIAKPLPQEAVADEIAASSAIIIPAPRSEEVAASLPLKLVEAGAVGRPIISTGFVPNWLNQTARHADSREEFVAALLASLTISDEKLMLASQNILSERTYRARNNLLLKLLGEVRGGM